MGTNRNIMSVAAAVILAGAGCKNEAPEDPFEREGKVLRATDRYKDQLLRTIEYKLTPDEVAKFPKYFSGLPAPAHEDDEPGYRYVKSVAASATRDQIARYPFPAEETAFLIHKGISPEQIFPYIQGEEGRTVTIYVAAWLIEKNISPDEAKKALYILDNLDGALVTYYFGAGIHNIEMADFITLVVLALRKNPTHAEKDPNAFVKGLYR